MSKEDDEKIQVWKDEIAMRGGVIDDKVKVKDLKKLNEDINEEEYNGGKAYAKAYNGVDMISIMSTKKDLKKHVYEKIKTD